MGQVHHTQAKEFVTIKDDVMELLTIDPKYIVTQRGQVNLPKPNEISSEATKWLWTCKLKSRDSFLMICSFINSSLTVFELKNMISSKEKEGWGLKDTDQIVDVQLTVLREVVSMLAPVGLDFFCQYINQRYLFISPIDEQRIFYGLVARLSSFDSNSNKLSQAYYKYKD